jgi:penicillin-binding protein 2
MLLSFGVIAVISVLVMRLWYLQIIKADDFKSQSEDNRLRFVPVAASRGAIMDRNSAVIVRNQPSFSLAVVPQEVKDMPVLLKRLSILLNADIQDMFERVEKAKGRARYYPVIIISGLTRDQLEIVEENKLRLPGVEIEMKPVREYSFKNLASHLLGYIGEISDKELLAAGYEEYNLGDYVGKNGIEKAWEQVLHGDDGGRQLEVDARGRVLRTISETYPTVGNSVVLTIDHRLQRDAEQAFGSQAGAAVVIDVNTGEILSLVSNPGFDPALFAGRIPQHIWKKYLEDKRHPLENKALTGQYPPGSTFKMITALAGLEESVVSESSSVVCKGHYEFGGNKFGCWNRSGHGTVNLKRSLKESCDVYYYQLGEKLGVDRIAKIAQKFHLGELMGVGLQNEKKGLIPTTEWKMKRFGKRWFAGETLPVSIGQGYVLMTPIQMASMVATVANEGTVYRPHLVKKVVDADGNTLQEVMPEVLGTTGISPKHFRIVKQGMYAVVNDAGGTGANARLGDVRVAGKTGTSQVVKLRDDKKKRMAYEYQDHALFVAFAPYDKPEVAVAVVVEHGGGGGAVAAPIAGRILRKYFDLKRPQSRPETDSSAGDENDTSEEQGTAGSSPVASEVAQ